MERGIEWPKQISSAGIKIIIYAGRINFRLFKKYLLRNKIILIFNILDNKLQM
jgi:hypothetical protein